MMNRARFERNSYKWWVLATVSLGSVTVALDNTIVACLPHLAKVFRTNSAVIAWVNIVYFIASLGFMLTLGKIGDAKGRKKVFMTGLVFYAAGLVVCALSQNIGQLLIGRAIQGIGVATGYSLSMAIAVAVFPEDERGKALGILAGANALGLVIAPILGGLILDLIGWRAVFFIRLPLSLAAFLMTWVIIEEQDVGEKKFNLDVKGSVSLFGCLSSFLLFLGFAGKGSLRTSIAIPLGCSILSFFIWFLYSEKRALQPLIELGLFKNRYFAVATVNSFLHSVSTGHVLLLTPFYIVSGLGHSASTVGLFMGMLALPIILISPISGRICDRIGSNTLVIAGNIVLCGSLFVMSYLGGQSTFLNLGIGVILVGAGMAIFMPSNNSAIMGAVPTHMLGTASAVAQTARQMGASSGIALAGALFSGRQALYLTHYSEKGLDPMTAEKLASVSGFQDAMLVASAIAIGGILVSLARGHKNQIHVTERS